VSVAANRLLNAAVWQSRPRSPNKKIKNT